MSAATEDARETTRAEGNGASQPEGERRRRRRGGRDRNREGREPRDGARVQQSADVPAADAGALAAMAMPLPTEPAAEREVEQHVSPVGANHTEQPALAATPAPEQLQERAAAEPVAAVVPEPVEESVVISEQAALGPVTETVATAPATNVAAAPAAVPIEQVLQDSGLVLVQTRKDVQVETVPELEFRPPKRERRPPPPEVPMVQVQTRKDQAP